MIQSFLLPTVSLCDWVEMDRPAAWIHIPIEQSHLIAAAANQGFVFHHAEGLRATMCQWLRNATPNKLPMFGTHQIGVAGENKTVTKLMC